MTLIIIILGILLVLALVGIGISIVIGDKADEDKTSENIKDSGEYSVKINLLNEDFSKAKPSIEKIKEYLNTEKPDLGEEKVEELIKQWQESIDNTVSVVEEGSRQKIKTFAYKFTDEDIKYCKFLADGNYISIEQIYNHKELLPPFHLGCKVQLVPRDASDFSENEVWKSIQPVEGKYVVPDWRQIAD